MTMDGFATFGFVGTIVQFIDVGFQLIKLLYQIDRDGITKDAAAYQEHAARIDNLIEPWSNSLARQRHIDQNVYDLADRCLKTARELRDYLRKLEQSSKPQKLAMGVKNLFSKELEGLEKKLQSHQRDLDTGILESLHDYARKAQVDLDNGLQDIIIKLADGCTSSRELVLRQTKAIQDHTTAESGATRDLIATESESTRLHTTSENDTTRDHTTAEHESTRQHVTDQLHSMKTVEHQQAFLSSLTFDEVDLREQDIPDPGEKTCQWLFKADSDTPDTPNFGAWYQSSARFFVVYGKPGSGKSVLMKLICQYYEQTRLRRYPDGRTPLHVGFFFWRDGHEKQRNSQGLLQSILLQIYRAQPDIYDQLVVVSPKYRTMKTQSWSISELHDLLRQTLELLQKPLVVFVDGLDEFEDGPSSFQSSQVLMKTLDALSAHAGVRLCLSTRPETVWKQRFAASTSVYLEKVNANCIRNFVRHRLSKLSQAESYITNSIAHIAKSIMKNAEGVFLWASLAVDSVEEGVMNGDEPELLSKRLESLPDELSEIFEQLWRKIMRPPYEEANILAFRLILDREMPLLEFALASTSSAQDADLITPSPSTLSQMLELCPMTERRILARCGNFFSVFPGSTLSFDHADELSSGIHLHSDTAKIPFWGPRALTGLANELARFQRNIRVRFMHRTAREFIASKLTKALVTAHGSDEALHLRMVRAKLSLWLLDVTNSVAVVPPPPDQGDYCVQQ
jgi:Cdc6-like AAA superfamily ATPase